MSRRLRSLLGFGLALVACGAAAPGSAAADGLPLPIDGANITGVVDPSGDFRYSTVPAGRNTAVVRIATGTGDIQRMTTLRGEFGVPLVAYDGTPSGLSADGETLVLIRPRARFPRQTTQFAVLDPERLRLRERITLRDDFSYDALSPDGRALYLIHYPDPRDPTSYEVRAYDLDRGRLLRDPIVDPDEAGEAMAGFPQTRAMSPDGRWAYTLYSRADPRDPPFIHALDTQRAAAVCIDLDPGLVEPRRVHRMTLDPTPDGAVLGVVDRGTPVATVDTETFEVSEAPLPGSEETGDESDGLSWTLVGICALAIAAGSLALARRRRDRGDHEDQLERLVQLDEVGADEEAQEREPVP